MGRFASTVAYYESARPPYGAAFFAGVALELGLDGSQRLLDVGAGPGILAIGFARFCRVIDMYLVDSLVDLLGHLPRFVGILFRPMQNGLVQFYALAMVLGLTVFLLALVRALAQ